MNSSTNAHAKTVRKVSNNKVKLEISSCPGVKKGSSEACSNIQGNKKSTAVKAIKKVQENKKSTKANAIKEESRPGTFLSTNLPTKKEESKLKKKEYIPEKISSSETVFPKKEPKKEPKVVSKQCGTHEGRASKVNGITPKTSIQVVSSSMTIVQLKEECKIRDSGTKGLSGKSKSWLLDYLKIGSEQEGSKEWQRKSDEETQNLHVYTSLCHLHPLADSNTIRVSKHLQLGTRCLRKRRDMAVCDVEHSFLCKRRPYRSCDKCDFDICHVCFEINSLPDLQKNQLLQDKYDKLNQEQEDAERIFQERQRQTEQEERKLSQEQEEAERLFQVRQRQIEQEERLRETKREKEMLLELAEKYAEDLANFSQNVRNPGAKNTNKSKKLKYTVWKSSGYDRDGWHSYEGPPQKEFDSSYDTLEQANQRVEYVFYFENVWETEKDEMYAECDKINSSHGTRLMSCRPDDSERWTVSVAPSSAFEFMVSFESM